MFRMPISGIDVELRHATGEEDLLLLEGGGDIVSTSIALVQRLAVPSEGGELDAAALTVPDLEALLLELRRRTLGDMVSTRGTCPEPECATAIDLSFRVSEYLRNHRVRKPANAEPVEGEPNWFQLRGSGVQFRLVTAGDLAAAAASANPERELARLTIRSLANGAPRRGTRREERAMDLLAPPLTAFPSNNPTAAQDVAAATVPPGSCPEGNGDTCTKFGPGPWTLKASNTAYYHQPENAHECVRVDLSSAVGTTFMNNSAFNNFYFPGTASTFKSFPAFVSARYPQVGTNNQQTFQWKVIKKPMTGKQGETFLSRAGRKPAVATESNTNYLSFIVDGCRLTGKTLSMPARNVDGRRTGKSVVFRDCDSVGSYGYLIRYDGPVDTWNYNLYASGSGVSLSPIAINRILYSLVIPQGQTAQIVTTVIPTAAGGGGGTLPPAGKFAAFLDLGANFPQGAFSNSVNNGFSLNAGLEYLVTSHLSAEGIFGYHYFSAKAGGSGSVYQFSSDAKAYLATGKLRPFISFGIGGYVFSPGSTHFGGNAGGGVLYNLSSHWGVEGSYDFHAVDTPARATKFSTLQGGVRYVF